MPKKVGTLGTTRARNAKGKPLNDPRENPERISGRNCDKRNLVKEGVDRRLDLFCSVKKPSHTDAARRRPKNREAQMRSLGRRIYAIRRARGMTQAELAKGTGVSRREVQNWEAGDRNARSRLPEIAAALAVTEADLLNFAGAIPPPMQTMSDDRRRAQGMHHLDKPPPQPKVGGGGDR
jgi:transcriptional regulator with XRE-family HTH domain